LPAESPTARAGRAGAAYRAEDARAGAPGFRLAAGSSAAAEARAPGFDEGKAFVAARSFAAAEDLAPPPYY
ncbi:MAG TPA: hypothetical protein PLG14_06790, partial [Spirochaetales bacterium]|nr:hypothetical protein [Spirochaetales bacterium]